MRYSFGKNWTEFIEQHFDEERVTLAQDNILQFLHVQDLRDKRFLDIGCGSGLHSLAAFRSGAKEIYSFDFDVQSVEATKKLHELSGSPSHWTVSQGSILDDQFLSTIQKADIVYSWGVLHHTGAMWAAIEKAVSMMKDSGVLYIALYSSDVHISPTPAFWIKVKRAYNQAGAFGKACMEWAYTIRYTFLSRLWRGKNPFQPLLEKRRDRGMTYWTDLKDWLGGWPMEFAGNAETKHFCQASLGLELIHIRAGGENTEYLFRKINAENYWDRVLASAKQEYLAKPYAHWKGFAWRVPLQQYQERADCKSHPRRSNLMLYEDGVPLGFAHVPHKNVGAYGQSRYSHWMDALIFSSTDNSNPNSNGRTYSVREIL